MLRHQNNNLLSGQSQGNFQHLLHRIEHPNRDLQILTFLKNLLISIESTPKIVLQYFKEDVASKFNNYKYFLTIS